MRIYIESHIKSKKKKKIQYTTFCKLKNIYIPNKSTGRGTAFEIGVQYAFSDPDVTS